MILGREKKYFFIYSLIIFLLGLSLNSLAFLFIPFGIFIGYVVLLNKSKNEAVKFRIPKYFIYLLFLSFLISRLFPFLESSHPLGYDTGFYNHEIEKQRQVIAGERENMAVLPVNVPGLGLNNKNIKPIMTDSIVDKALMRVMIKTGFSNSMILYDFYITLGLIIGFLIYLIARQYFNREAAFFSLFIYLISLVQFEAYYFMLWKNFLGLVLLLFIFYALSRRAKLYYVLAIFGTLLIFLTHRTTAFVLIITLLIYYLVNKNKYKPLVITGLIIISGIFIFWNQGLLFYIIDKWRSGFSSGGDFFSIRQGDFLSVKQFLSLALLYIPFALAAGIKLFKEKKQNPVLIMAGAVTVLTAINFIYYERLLIYLDLALIILSGQGIFIFIKNIDLKINFRTKQVLLALVLLAIIASSFVQIFKKEPAIAAGELEQIVALKDYREELTVFSSDIKYSSWLYGFSGHDILAPGWGGTWIRSDWEKYWQGTPTMKHQKLSDLDEEIIIIDKENLNFKHDCFKPVNEGFYLLYCN